MKCYASARSVRIGNRGATLLETLLALMLMALIAALIAPSFALLGRFGNRSSQDDQNLSAALARMSLQRSLAEMPFRSPHPDIQSSALFTGEAGAFGFVSFQDGSQTTAARYLVAYSSETSELFVTTNFVTSSQTPTSRATLLQNVTTCDFEYWERQRGWSTSWVEPTQAPELIKISCDTANQGPAVPIVLQPRLNARQKLKSRSSLVPPANPSRP
mgnify:CR=1 FL=1